MNKKKGAGITCTLLSLHIGKRYFRMVGSMVSLTQSPNRHMLSVVRNMVRPGITASHQLVII